jgi:DNA invertase Pin-like site-specific DNA recombinase
LTFVNANVTLPLLGDSDLQGAVIMAVEIIGYLRVSTKKQGESGLGLEGQKTAVEGYARQTGARVGAWYTEVETGKRADRPELSRALSHAKRSKAVLCVAKLDRLARNVAFTSALMDSGVNFVACDNPTANRLTIHILAAMAEHEAEQISKRTKDALAAAKARGTLLGSARPDHWKGHEEARLAGARKAALVSAKIRSRDASEAYSDLLPDVAKLNAQGMSLRAIAEKLNTEGHTTRRGKPWNPVQVARVLDRKRQESATSS